MGSTLPAEPSTFPKRTAVMLRGKERLAEDLAAQLRFHRLFHDQVNASAQDLLEPPLHPEKMEQPDRPERLREGSSGCWL
jgi:hypothetical protein